MPHYGSQPSPRLSAEIEADQSKHPGRCSIHARIAWTEPDSERGVFAREIPPVSLAGLDERVGFRLQVGRYSRLQNELAEEVRGPVACRNSSEIRSSGWSVGVIQIDRSILAGPAEEPTRLTMSSAGAAPRKTPPTFRSVRNRP